MKTSLFHILSAALTLSFVSCVNSGMTEEGSLTLGVSLEKEVTRAVGSAGNGVEDAVVNIYFADHSGLVRTYRISDMPEKIWLAADDYRVDVLAGEILNQEPCKASWESRSYKGSTLFSIVPGQDTEVKVNAKVINVVSKVSFAPSLRQFFRSGYTLTIGVDGHELVYDEGKSGAEGYFIPDSDSDIAFDWKFEGILTGGTPFEKSGRVNGVEAGKLYSMTMTYVDNNGYFSFDLKVDPGTLDIPGTIVFEPVATGLSEIPVYEIWAGHTTLRAFVDENEYKDAAEISLEYGTDGSNWTTLTTYMESEGVYYAPLAGLSPSTAYHYRLVIDGEQIGDPMTFTTPAAPSIPNGSFEETSKSSSGNYTEFYSAGSSPWWGSGNGSDGVTGSADFGSFVVCKPDTGTKVDGNQSVCLVSQWALVKFAAGNLFSGYFGGLVGTKGGKVYFGRPFTGRPTALKVWVKYSAGKIDRVESVPAGANVTKDQTYDIGRVQIALGNWNYKTYGGTKECPILVNTTEASTFVNFATDKSTIAFGDLQLQSDASDRYNSWAEYTIPIEYRDIVTMPSYIVISCASSMYGDYFTGCSSSKMWIDKMELVYE